MFVYCISYFLINFESKGSHFLKVSKLFGRRCCQNLIHMALGTVQFLCSLTCAFFFFFLNLMKSIVTFGFELARTSARQPDLYTSCLHGSISFLYCLCQLLLFPQWNFFLPPFINQLFLVFEPRFILCTLASSHWLTPGSRLKTSGSDWSWELHFLSGGC